MKIQVLTQIYVNLYTIYIIFFLCGIPKTEKPPVFAHHILRDTVSAQG